MPAVPPPPPLTPYPQEIAKRKQPDTNATKLPSVVKMVEGTARSLGLKVVE
jgi:large subunit ribosomal protein L11